MSIKALTEGWDYYYGYVIDGAFRISRTGHTNSFGSPLTVYWQRAGTATPPPSGGADYTVGVNGSFGNYTSATIPAYKEFIDVTIRPYLDVNYSDGTETVEFTIVNSPSFDYRPADSPEDKATVNIHDTRDSH
ncbi:MAG: hypothetical protein M5U12_35300 [Verrucomicrobia bacterium]|nr:hypothetical protein [Verrucomicrobiota bacterium]